MCPPSRSTELAGTQEQDPNGHPGSERRDRAPEQQDRTHSSGGRLPWDFRTEGYSESSEPPLAAPQLAYQTFGHMIEF